MFPWQIIKGQKLELRSGLTGWSIELNGVQVWYMSCTEDYYASEQSAITAHGNFIVALSKGA